MKRKLLTLLTLATCLVSALLVGNWEYKFFPRNRVEIAHSTSKNRAFTSSYGFVDLSIVLCVDDWPHTFTSPVILGDVYSEGYPVYHIHWSSDGSILALRIKRNLLEPEYFVSAYDFSKHVFIQNSQFANLNDSNSSISQLLSERGGVEPAIMGVDDGKIPEYRETFPAWCWFVPLLIIGIGLTTAIKNW